MLSAWWERITKRLMDYIMQYAKTNSGFSFRDYNEMQETYKEIYGKYYDPKKSTSKY